MIDQSHFLLGTNLSIQTPFRGGEIKPKFLALYGTRKELEELIFDFTENEDIKESTHIIVTTRGSDIFQLAPFNVKTWHTGASCWQGHYGLNNYTIGIHVQLDEYLKIDSGSATVLHEIIPDIVAHYNIRSIIDHQRPEGINLNTLPYRKYVEYGNSDTIGRFALVMEMDVYGGPGVNFAVLDTLQSGSVVKVLKYSKNDEWAFIQFERRGEGHPQYGWVIESFLKRL